MLQDRLLELKVCCREQRLTEADDSACGVLLLPCLSGRLHTGPVGLAHHLLVAPG